MKQTALSDPEKEVCGFVYSDHYVSLTNQRSSENMFVADPQSVARALARLGEPDAIFHTHPNGILRPSTEDLACWHYPRSILIIGVIARKDLTHRAFFNVETAEIKSR